MKVDRIVHALAAAAVPLLALLVHQGVLSASLAADLTAVDVALVGAYHLPNDRARTALDQSPVEPEMVPGD